MKLRLDRDCHQSKLLRMRRDVKKVRFECQTIPSLKFNRILYVDYFFSPYGMMRLIFTLFNIQIWPDRCCEIHSRVIPQRSELTQTECELKNKQALVLHSVLDDSDKSQAVTSTWNNGLRYVKECTLVCFL